MLCLIFYIVDSLFEKLEPFYSPRNFQLPFFVNFKNIGRINGQEHVWKVKAEYN